MSVDNSIDYNFSVILYKAERLISFLTQMIWHNFSFYCIFVNYSVS